MLFIGIILVIVALPLWIVVVQCGLSQHDSDPAGNGLAQAYSALAGLALWVVLALLLLISAVHGGIPFWAGAMAFVLVPASGLAAQAALGVMSEVQNLKWPIVVPAVAPALMIAYSAWCFFPSIHERTGTALPGIIVWGTMLALLAVPWLARREQARVLAAIPTKTPEEIAQRERLDREEQRAQEAESFHKLAPDSPLRDWWAYTESDEFRAEAMEGARAAKNRQTEVVGMLADGPKSLFLALPRLDLAVTPEIEQAVRGYLMQQVGRLRPFEPGGSITTKIVTDWYEDYFPTIQWLVENHGTCDTELTALAGAVSQYPDGPERQMFLEKLQSFRRTNG